MKKNLLALGTCTFALALGLVACDDSTSANGSSGDENPAEVSSSSILTTSSPTEDPGSSSSSVILSGGSAGVEGSSSSVTSSSSMESSSSVVSSSSEKSSSSVASSSSAKGNSSVASSGSVESSSSSVILSSSSEESSIKDGSEYNASANTLTDLRDGQVYKTIVICDKENKSCQTWMAQNLNYDPGDVSSMGDYAWSGCYGDGDWDFTSNKNLTDEEVAANCSKYGRLYTWEVAMNDASCAYGTTCGASLNPTTPVRGVCPQGWHLPSHYEFEELINYIDPTFKYNHTDDAYSSTAGQYLKSKSGWNSRGNGRDAYGFSALPGGFRNDVAFDFVGEFARFWSSGEYSSNDAFYLGLSYESGYARLKWYDKNYASSVRCLKD